MTSPTFSHGYVSLEPQPEPADLPLGARCLWDDCDDRAHYSRWSHQRQEHLPVCFWHTEIGEEELIVNKWIMRKVVQAVPQP